MTVKHDLNVSKRLFDFMCCRCGNKEPTWIVERWRTMGYLLDNIAYTYRYVYPEHYDIKYHDNTNIGD